MLTLYAAPPSGNCYKILLTLAQLDRPCKVVWIDLHAPRDRSIRAGSPLALVPLLETDDGPIAESGAILLYLAEGSSLLPPEPALRAQVHQWMFFEQNLHEPFIATSRYWRTLAPDPSRRAAQLPFWEERGKQTLGTMDRHLERHDFFAADRYTLADIALFAYTHVAPEGGFELEPFPAVQAWLERVRQQPGFVSMTSLHPPSA